MEQDQSSSGVSSHLSSHSGIQFLGKRAAMMDLTAYIGLGELPAPSRADGKRTQVSNPSHRGGLTSECAEYEILRQISDKDEKFHTPAACVSNT